MSNYNTKWGSETALFIGIKKNLRNNLFFHLLQQMLSAQIEISIQAKKFSLFEYHSRKMADVRGLLVVTTRTASTFSGALTVLALPTPLLVV
jgi:hypothetical protein